MPGAWLRRLWGLSGEQRGSIGPLLALLMAPTIGAMGLATESASWFFVQRAAQNAADAAVLAAASNGSATAAPTYVQEALAVAAKYGFVNGAANATVTAVNNVACPSPSTLTNCFKVTVTKKTPIALTTLVGYNGDTTVNGDPAVLISASAIASKPIPLPYCMIAMAHGMGTGDAAFDLRGAPKANFGGCSVFSNASENCTGQSGATIGAGTTVDTDPNKPCGTPNPGAAALTAGPYDGLASEIPAPGSCHTVSSPSTGGTTLNWSSYSCVTISGNFSVPAGVTTITPATGGTVLLIQNGGSIALAANATLKTAFDPTAGLTVVYTGLSGGKPGFVTGGNGSALDFAAPTTGTWSGMAMYQDSTTASSYTYSGNSPTFDITGIINAPYMNIQLNGAVNKQSNGYSCISFIVNSITSNGTGYIFATNPTSQCHQAGVDPTLGAPNSVSVRQALLQ